MEIQTEIRAIPAQVMVASDQKQDETDGYLTSEGLRLKKHPAQFNTSNVVLGADSSCVVRSSVYTLCSSQRMVSFQHQT